MWFRSNHWMARLMSARKPSNSRQTFPISSVTLAWRTLVVTGNLCPNCQITGVVMSRGGYISQRRVFCEPASIFAVGRGFGLALRGMVKRSLTLALRFGSFFLSAGNRRDDTDLVAVFE